MPTNPEIVDDEIATEAPEADDTSLRDDLAANFREMAAREDGRDENGRFKAKEEAAPVEAVEPVEPVEPEAPQVPEIEAPQALSADAKAKWAETPPEVRADIVKRETEVRQMVGRMDGERQFGRQINDIVTPYLPIMRANNIQPVELITRMMNTEYVLATGDPIAKARMFMEAASQYGIDMDLAMQFRNQPPQEQAAPPRVDINAEVERVLNEREQARLQREVENEAQAFMSDPKNVHAASVSNMMASLLSGGDATTLQEAYDMAVYARPDLRSTYIAAEVAKEEAKRAERATQARQAAVSLPGTSGSSRPVGSTDTPLREMLRTGLRAMDARV